MAALQYVIVDQPKAARQKSSFTWWQAVPGVFGFVAKHEFIPDQKSILDCLKRSADPRVLGRKKADHRDQQQTGIELLGAVGLHGTVEGAGVTAGPALGMDFVGDLPPSRPPTR